MHVAHMKKFKFYKKYIKQCNKMYIKCLQAKLENIFYRYLDFSFEICLFFIRLQKLIFFGSYIGITLSSALSEDGWIPDNNFSFSE